MDRPSMSVIAAPPGEGQRWHQRAIGLGGILLGLWVALMIIAGPHDDGLRDLDGPWEAVLIHDDHTVTPITVRLPGLFAYQGLPPEARIHATREVRVGPGPQAVLIDRPRYAATVTWDGRPLASTGDPGSSGRRSRSSEALFAALPEAEAGSTHRLGIEIRGDYGSGGLTGRIRIGPGPQIHAAGRLAEARRLAMALGILFLGALPLVVASRGPWRPTYLFFGLSCVATGLWAMLQSDLAYTLLPDALSNQRAQRICLPWVLALLPATADAFAVGRTGRLTTGWLAVAGCMSVAGQIVPSGGLFTLERLADLVFAPISLALFALHARRAFQDRVPGAALLIAAGLPFCVAMLSEVSLTHGLRTGDSYTLATSLFFATFIGTAIVVRDAQISEQHDRLVRGSLDAMVTVDPEGWIQDANPAATRLIAPGADHLLELVDPSDRPRFRAHLARALVRSDRTEIRTARGDALESLATALNHRLLLLTLRDITTRRDLDRSMMQAARMETVGLLLGGLAHDFNNMLNSLLAHLGMFRLAVASPRDLERIDRMEGTIDRASDLARRLFTVARGTGSPLGSCDPVAVVRGAAELVDPTLPPGIDLVVQLPEALPAVLGDRRDLEQVLVNLLVNAIDALGTSGTLRITAAAFDHGVALMVEDDGPGIPDDRKEEVFHPFVTTKPTGTGLGLAVARQILSDHHGRIWIEDGTGPSGATGTRFVLALRPAQAVSTSPPPLPDGRRLLVVEDEAILLEEYARVLTEAGYDVTACQDPSRAASLLITLRPDLLVTDVVMPRVNGLELAALSHATFPEVPVLLVSAFIPQKNLRHLLASGPIHVLHKPARPDRLVGMVGSLRRRAEGTVASNTHLLPNLDHLTSAQLPFPEPSP